MIKHLNINILLSVVGLVCGIVMQFYFDFSVYSSVIFSFLCFLSMLLFSRYVWLLKYGNLLWSVCIITSFAAIGMLRSVDKFSSDFIFDNRAIHRAEIIEKSYETTKNIAYKTYLYSLEGKRTRAEILFERDSVTENFFPKTNILIKGENHKEVQNSPYAFDYNLYLKKQGFVKRIFVKNQKYFLLNTGEEALQSKIFNYINKKLKENHLEPIDIAMTQALLLGRRSDIPDKLYQDYISSGGVHLLAISGTHIGIFTAILMFFLSLFVRGFKRSKEIRLAILILILCGYAFCIGYPASVVRSVLTYALLSVYWYLGRDKNIIDGVVLALFTLILINPYYIFSVGFQLSFSAVISIVVLYPLLKSFWIPKNRILSYVVSLIYVSLSAQIGVLPISLYYFHQFPLLFLITNILIIPVMGVILFVGVGVVIASCVWFLPYGIKQIYHHLILYMNTVVSLVSDRSFFIIKNIYFDKIYVVLTFLLLMLFVLNIKTYSSKLRFGFVWIVFFLIVVVQLRVYNDKKEDIFYLTGGYRSEAIHYKRGVLNVYTDTILKHTQNNIDNILNNKYVKSVNWNKKKLFYSVAGKNILVIDHRAIIPKNNGLPIDVIILQSSPKINLERVLTEFSPTIVVADATNYTSFIERWEETCRNKKIRFHSIASCGFFKYE